MCEYINNNSTTLALPITNTKHVKYFKEFAGPGYIKSYYNSGTTPIAGCYLIYSDKMLASFFW